MAAPEIGLECSYVASGRSRSIGPYCQDMPGVIPKCVYVMLQLLQCKLASCNVSLADILSFVNLMVYEESAWRLMN